ncbi:MAG: hypothetical protein R3B13_27510 [Polyangiaceae bacterium]
MSECATGTGDHVSGGYFLARPARRSAHMTGGLLPEILVTASDCIVDLVPNTWSIEWTQETRTARQEEAVKFGLNPSELQSFTDWCTSALESGDLGWPCVFLSVEVALRVRHEFLARASSLVVFGIALPHDLVSTFVEETRLAAGQGEPGVRAAVRGRNAPSPGGSLLGYDVLGWEYGGFHSYVCNGLETEFARAFAIKPNRWGFFDRLDDARRCADHCNQETTGAEPALWMPWRVTLYDGSL